MNTPIHLQTTLKCGIISAWDQLFMDSLFPISLAAKSKVVPLPITQSAQQAPHSSLTRLILSDAKLFLTLKLMPLELDKFLVLQALTRWSFLISWWWIIVEEQRWSLVMDKAIQIILVSSGIHTLILSQGPPAAIAMELELFLAPAALVWECWLFQETVRLYLRNSVLDMTLFAELNHMKIRSTWRTSSSKISNRHILEI